MTTVRLTCPCGQTWDHPRDQPIPADLREICPSCTRVSPTPPKAAVTPAPDASSGSAGSPTSSRFTAESATGRSVAGFEVGDEINRGGMGVIYKARQIALNRIIALKAITPAKLDGPGVRARFTREVRAAARLNHPNIVTVFHTDLEGPFPYLAMEYVPGIDLLRLVKKTGPLLVSDAVYYVRQAAEGLQHAFEHGVVHRDIKPSNLIVTPSPLTAEGQKSGKMPKVKILDMGLARVIAPEGKEPDDLTPVGVFLGSPDYVAPEQAEDARQADTRADIFSLGGTLYFLLTGEVPFPGNTLMQKLRRVLTEPAPSAAARRRDVPPKLDAVIRKMLAKNPADRYQTPNDVIAALDRVTRAEAKGLPPVEEPDEPEFPPQAQVKGHAGAVRGLAAAPDGHAVVSAGDDGMLKVWDPAKLAELRGFLADLGAVGQLVVAPNGKWAATCSDRLTPSEIGVQLWDLATGAERKRLRGPADNLRCVAVSPDGKSIVAGSEDSMVWVWVTDPTGPKTFCMKGHAGAVTGIAFVSGDKLLTAGADGTVRQWDVKGGKAKGVLPTGVGPITAMAFGGKRVAAAGQGLAIRLPTGAFVKLAGHDGNVLSCAMSPDGRVLASGGADKTVRLWSAEEGTELAVIPGFDSGVRAIAFDASSKVFFTGTDAGTLARWSVPGS